jgi:protein TonB
MIACALHVVVLLGVGFSAQQTPAYSPQIEVTLARRPSDFTPDEAKLLAQADQIGTNEQELYQEAARVLPTSRVEPVRESSLKPQVVTRAKASRLEQELTTLSPEVERLKRELEQLEADLEQQTQAYEDRPRVRRLTAASTKRAVDAAYLHDWRMRLEAVGNRYYPEASMRYGIYGSLSLLVIIRHDGSLEDIRVLSSSGYAVLDEAAIKIVRMAAPFSPFPPELRATTDKLEIIRTWQFQENELSSG